MTPATRLQRAIDALEAARDQIDRATTQLFAVDTLDADAVVDLLTGHFCGLRDAQRELARVQTRTRLRVVGGCP